MGVKPPGDIPQKRLFLSTIIAFLSSIALTAAILVVIVSNKAQADKLIMEQMIMEKTERLTDIIHKLLYKTEALAALVVQNNGGINNFERVASTLLDDPAIANLLIAPGGVVSHVYPPRDNEA